MVLEAFFYSLTFFHLFSFHSSALHDNFNLTKNNNCINEIINSQYIRLIKFALLGDQTFLKKYFK